VETVVSRKLQLMGLKREKLGVVGIVSGNTVVHWGYHILWCFSYRQNSSGNFWEVFMAVEDE